MEEVSMRRCIEYTPKCLMVFINTHIFLSQDENFAAETAVAALPVFQTEGNGDMTSKAHTEGQQRWYRAVHLTIVDSIRTKMKSASAGSTVMEHLRWRLGFNLYSAGLYEEAMPILEEAAKQEEVYFSDDANMVSFINQTTGRCAVYLFRKSQQHSFLERAYVYYQNAVQNMAINLYTMFKLPLLLLEFGRVLEDYGAFQAANDVYSRILSGFPNFRGYFDALYRTAIVGRHLASLLTDPTNKEEALNKCLDVLQFLLEALPSTISDYQIVLLYGRTLELSSNPQIKFRAHSIYRSLFELCQNHYIAGATKNKEPAEWLDDPMSWFHLAEEIAAAGEPLVAKDAYQKFMELKERQAMMSYKFEAKDVSAHLDVATCVKLALSAARYQNYEEAIRYAEIGLKVDRYNKELRAHLSQWDQMHADHMRSEVAAVVSILSVWKGRCWTNGFRRKLKQKMIADCEERYRLNRFDWEAREALAYYAKNKYRAKFLFQEHCAVRIQRFFKKQKMQGVWLQAQRQHVFTLASEIMRRYQRFPYSAEVRENLVSISKHRLVPADHPIHAAREEIAQQRHAVDMFERCMHTCRMRRALTRKINETKKIKAEKMFNAARKIQCAARQMLAIARVERMHQHRILCIAAATTIQRWIRKIRGSFYTTVLKARNFEYMRRKRAMDLLRLHLPGMIQSFIFAKKTRKKVQHHKAQDVAHRAYRKEQLDKFEKASILIQRFQRVRHRKFLSKLSKEALQRRKDAGLSLPGTDLLAACRGDASTHYQIPGINQKAPQFVRATQQKTIFCSGDAHFSPADCLMLSMVLRSPACAVKTLVLHSIHETDNPCYEFDLLAALRKCSSIRAVHILGGDWGQSFVLALVQVVHVENPRITTLALEHIPRAALFADPLAQRAACLLMDYFNYSIPGICHLNLHGCNLSDANAALLCDGIAVNSSIRFLTLSLNLIEDSGFVKIFKAFIGNRKSKIEMLDFSYNLIQSTREVKRMLLAYVPHNLNAVLVIYLMFNRIYQYYHPMNDLKNRNQDASAMTIIYTPADLLALRHPHHLISARKARTGAAFDPPPPPRVAATHTFSSVASDMHSRELNSEGSFKLRLLRKMHSASTSSGLSHDGSRSAASSSSNLSRSLTSAHSSASALKPLGSSRLGGSSSNLSSSGLGKNVSYNV